MSHDRYESADFSPGIYIGTLEASRVVRSVQTGNVGVTAYWAVTDVFGRASWTAKGSEKPESLGALF